MTSPTSIGKSPTHHSRGGDFGDPFIEPLFVLGAVFGGRLSGGGTCFVFSEDDVVKFSAEEWEVFFAGGCSLSSSLDTSRRSSIEWKVF